MANNKARILSREDLLSASNLHKELVDIEGLGQLYLRELSTADVVKFNQRIRDMRTAGEVDLTTSNGAVLMALVMALSVCDERGELLFTEEDVPALLVNSINVLTQISGHVLRISKLDPSISKALSSEVAANQKNEVMTSSSQS